MYIYVITMILLASRDINNEILSFCPRITIGYIDWDSDDIDAYTLKRICIINTRLQLY